MDWRIDLEKKPNPMATLAILVKDKPFIAAEVTIIRPASPAIMMPSATIPIPSKSQPRFLIEGEGLLQLN